MDDFIVVGEYFNRCLENLVEVLKRCEDSNLVLNWEKCHFSLKMGRVLGLGISKKGVEVGKVKVEAIKKLPPPILIKYYRTFERSEGFYKNFINVFSKIVLPLC